MSSKNRLSCFGARDQGRCDNHLTIRRDEVEARVLTALQDKLLRQDLFEEFCDEFTREMNRLRMPRSALFFVGLRPTPRLATRCALRRYAGDEHRIHVPDRITVLVSQSPSGFRPRRKHLSHLRGERSARERFLQERRVHFDDAVVRDRVVCVAGQIQHA